MLGMGNIYFQSTLSNIMQVELHSVLIEGRQATAKDGTGRIALAGGAAGLSNLE